MTTDITELTQESARESGSILIIVAARMARREFFTPLHALCESGKRVVSTRALCDAVERAEEHMVSQVSKIVDGHDRLTKKLKEAESRNAELVEALEKERRICSTWRKTAEANSENLEKAQAKNALVAGGIEAAAKLHERIGELEPIRAAAEKLVRCKGRYHSEQNYRALASLFGVTTPDLPLPDGESRTVTVKLPQDEDGQPFGFARWASSKLPASTGTMTISYCEDAWRAALEVFASAAGIKLQIEGE